MDGDRRVSVTAEPYFPPMGYLVIKPMSPAILYVVDDTTVGAVLEGVVYEGVREPTLLVREMSVGTG